MISFEIWLEFNLEVLLNSTLTSFDVVLFVVVICLLFKIDSIAGSNQVIHFMGSINRKSDSSDRFSALWLRSSVVSVLSI